MKAVLFPLLLAAAGTSGLCLRHWNVSKCLAAAVVKGGSSAQDVDAGRSSSSAPLESSSAPAPFASTPKWQRLKQAMCPNMQPNPNVRSALFELARLELGLAESALHKNFTDAFFTFSSGGIGYASPNGKDHMVYLRVWKAANNQIRENLNATLFDTGGQLWERHGGNAEGGLLKAFEQGWPTLWSPIQRGKLNNTCVVTAIRDPITHFLSGYNEMEHRVATEKWHQWETKRNPKPLLFSRYRNGTEARFEQFVADFLSGELFPSMPQYNIYHVFSMTGVLWELSRVAEKLGVDAPKLTAYLPSVSDIDVEFPRLLSRNCKGLPKRSTQAFSEKFEHQSQKDELGFYAAAKRVWSKEDGTARALCALHALDYACFDALPVPEVCQDVFSGEQFGDHLIRAATLIGMESGRSSTTT